MPKAASKHGLERKFKPFRKGKGKGKSASKGSLKSQIRSKARLLSKLPPDDSRRSRLEAEKAALEAQVSEKATLQVARKNAMKYHAVKFFERQKLTRALKKAETAGEQSHRCRENNSSFVLRERLLLSHVVLTHRRTPSQKTTAQRPKRRWRGR